MWYIHTTTIVAKKNNTAHSENPIGCQRTAVCVRWYHIVDRGVFTLREMNGAQLKDGRSKISSIQTGGGLYADSHSNG